MARKSALVALAVGAAALPWVSGCPGGAVDARAGFENADPARRVAAIRQAVASDDRGALPQLVACLSDPEVDVRLFAIVGLRKMTGEDLGYRHYDPEPARAEAIERWRRFLREHPAGRPR